MSQSILITNRFKKKAEVKTIDYILAIPAAVAIKTYIDGFKAGNVFLNIGRAEFSTTVSLITLRATAEVIAEYRSFIVDAINELKEG